MMPGCLAKRCMCFQFTIGVRDPWRIWKCKNEGKEDGMDTDEKKTLEKHTAALNRVANVMEGFVDGLPGLVAKLEKNEALLRLQQERTSIRDQIGGAIQNYERKKKGKNNGKKEVQKKEK